MDLLDAGRTPAWRAEAAKIMAFLRRDVLVEWSYRVAVVSDAGHLIAQAVVFSFVGRMVDEAALPAYGGTPASYLGFVTIGIALTGFLHVGLGRVVGAIRKERFMGTFECLLMTPTRPTTMLLGLVSYDVLYVPLRTAVFLGVMAGGFGVGFRLAGLGPALAIVIAFVPFVWGCALLSAAGVIAFRRGSGGFGFAAWALTLVSGAYFPLDLLPGWVAAPARLNPIALALDGARAALIGGAGWPDVAPALLILVASAAATLALGTAALRLAFRREQRLGAIGLY
jgi:ABC-2 type transport system permease protein